QKLELYVSDSSASGAVEYDSDIDPPRIKVDVAEDFKVLPILRPDGALIHVVEETGLARRLPLAPKPKLSAVCWSCGVHSDRSAKADLLAAIGSGVKRLHEVAKRRLCSLL